MSYDAGSFGSFRPVDPSRPNGPQPKSPQGESVREELQKLPPKEVQEMLKAFKKDKPAGQPPVSQPPPHGPGGRLNIAV